jgi:hypothetical protein
MLAVGIVLVLSVAWLLACVIDDLIGAIAFVVGVLLFGVLVALIAGLLKLAWLA